MNLLKKLQEISGKMSKFTFAVLDFETQKPPKCWSNVKQFSKITSVLNVFDFGSM